MRFPLVPGILLLTVGAVMATALPTPVLAQQPASPPYDFPAYYTKAEYEIPMRDGVKLFTAVYMPKDTSEKHPILLNRTPYGVGPYGADKFPFLGGTSLAYAKEGYIIVRQDVRGREHSGGQWEEMRHHLEKKSPTDIDESTDTYDTVDWLVKNIPNNNGRVGMSGISYPGFFVSSGIIHTHPAIKAASPQAPVSDLYMGDDEFHNGCFLLPHNFTFFIFFGRPGKPPIDLGTPDGYQFYLDMGPVINTDRNYMKGDYAYWTESLQHPNYDDFWRRQNILPHLHDISTAVMTVGGWYDGEDLSGTLKTFRAIEQQNPGLATNLLVMGPWSHGGWSRAPGDQLGDARFGEKTGAFYRENIEVPFFNYYLKDKGTLNLPKAYCFETGANRWRKFSSWPPKEATAKTLYLLPGGKVGFDPPTNDSTPFDEYVSDPAKPVPSTYRITVGMPGDYMTEDQRFSSNRTDVLVYQSEPLPEDITIVGPVSPKLFAATSGTDSDYVVKLVDVYPPNTPNEPEERPGFARGGYQFMVRGEPMRAKFRNSFEKPEPMTPNVPVSVSWVMPDVLHTFKKGHRIMVQVQSSWFPFIDRNPQTFIPNIFEAKESDFRKATERIYHTAKMPSGVNVLVLPATP
jgi:putative CocE/NonD family hydrolase